MEEHEAQAVIKELLEKSTACCLTTSDDKNHPQTRAMLNLKNASMYPGLVDFFKGYDDYLVIFTTNTSSVKVAQIRNNPWVSVYYANAHEFKGLMLGGKMTIVTDQKIKDSLWQDNWTMYYPGGMTDTDYTVLELKPKLLKVYHQLGAFTIDKE